MNKFYFFLIALFLVNGTIAQTVQPYSTCLPDGITFSTQAQIDSFQVNYPNCTEILGNVYIDDNDTLQGTITNLNGLSVVTFIGGHLKVWDNPALTNLNGLENLNAVGGDLQIGHFLNPNPNLENLTGLEGLTSIEGTLFIHYNPSLISLTGLENLTYIGGELRILRNDSLSNLTGLMNLTTIGHGLIIGMDVFGNHGLTSLTGLENLTFVGGDLLIEDNSSLTTLIGLEHLTHISGQIFIIGNDVLTSLNGLDQIGANTISHLTVNWNLSLSDCAIQNICEYLLSINGSAYFIGNSDGCNSRDEVEAACGVGVGESAVGSRESAVKIYPNSSNSTITIELADTFELRNYTTLTIYNLNGQQFIRLLITEQKTVVDKPGLVSGVYILKVVSDDNVWTEKFVKQ